MNLLELRKYKKRLNLQRYLCFAMTFFMLTNAAKEFNRNVENSDSTEDISYESVVDYPVTSKVESCISAAISVQESKIAWGGGSLKSEPIQIETLEPTELTYEEKMLAIMEKDGYTYEELDAVCAACVAESYGDGNCYDECYDIASVFYNRTHSYAYVADVDKAFGENTGYSYYNQLRAPSQFSVWSNGSYKDHLGRIDLLGYQAAIDMFYSKEPSNDYLNFNCVPPKSGSYEQLNPSYGNYFSRHQKIEDVIEDEKVVELVLTLHN